MNNWYDDIFNIVQECDEFVDDLTEVKKKKAKGGKCVPMKSKERSLRKRKAKKGALKRKAKASKIKKKRAKAMRKRKAFGIK